MTMTLTRRVLIASAASCALLATVAQAKDAPVLRLSAVASETDQRAVALTQVFAPAVAGIATFEPHWNATLFAQGTELEAIASGDLDMTITSAQEIATFLPEWSIFAAGYVLQDAEHQIAVFNDPLMDPFKQALRDNLGVHLLAPMYLGRRQVNLRQSEDDLKVMTPDDLAGVNLRMPGSDAWQFLGRALGANPTPMAFTEVYTALQSGAVDGQDNPLPTMVDAKFFEVTKQVVLTSHLVDWNFIAISAEVFDGLDAAAQDTLSQAAWDAAAFGRGKQLAQEESLVTFLREKGLAVYEPDLTAFRTHVQEAYLASNLAGNWPKGTLEAINALGH